MAQIDFGFNEGTASDKQVDANGNPITDLDNGNQVHLDADGNPITNLDDNKPDKHDDNHDNDDNHDDNTGNNNGEGDDKNKDSHTEESENIEPGTVYQIGDDVYTVDDNGNLVDKDNKIFKAANEVADFLKEFEEENTDENSIDMDAVIKAVGVEIKDDKDQVVTFENTPEGVASYLNNVLEVKRNEFAQAGVNKLVQDYPFVVDLINYYNANGGSLEGFGEVQDRTNITIDEANEAQQISIIKEAWKEFGKGGDVNKYVNYLKETGGLLDVAKEELEALKNKDIQNKTKLENEAREAQEAEQRRQMEYWGTVKQTIDSKQLGKYKIPDTIMRTNDGKTVAATPQDFFNYVYQINDEGKSRYMIDLEKQTKEDALNDELLRAYLMFTGKSYDSLVEMAKVEKEIVRLKAAKNNGTRKTIKITKPANKPGQNNNIDYGYND